MELILASTSPARRALLDGLGVPYRAVAPKVEEDVPAGTPPEQAVTLLAHRKAHAVHERFPSALVLGSDQLAVVDQRTLGKPKDRAAAAEQLRLLRERPHRIVTGVCLLGPGLRDEAVETAHLRFHPLSDAELERYLDLGEWQGCAGGYRIEAQGQALFASLEGDRTGVQGLPLLRVVDMLRRAGWTFFSK